MLRLILIWAVVSIVAGLIIGEMLTWCKRSDRS